MWVIAKINSKELSVFKSELNLKFENKVNYYFPKVFIKNKKTKVTKTSLEITYFVFTKNLKI